MQDRQEDGTENQEQGCAEGCVTCVGCLGTLLLCIGLSSFSPLLGIIMFVGYLIYAAEKHSGNLPN